MLKFLFLLLCLSMLLSSCQPSATSGEGFNFYVNHDHPSQTFDSRVQFLILHYTAVNEEKSFDLLIRKDWPASAHYLVTEKPEIRHSKPVIYQLVDEHERAWHAGLSNWGKAAGLNSASIGIEIVNYGFVDTDTDQSEIDQYIAQGYKLWESDDRYWFYYTPEQIAAVTVLAQDIVHRHNIDPENVLGHVDIAPTRKHDPGPLFPWHELYLAGVGAWYEAQTMSKYLAGRDPQLEINPDRLLRALKIYGYDVPLAPSMNASEQDQEKYAEHRRLVIRAFQMHFRPTSFSGIADAETEAIALALIERYKDEKTLKSIDPSLVTLI